MATQNIYALTDTWNAGATTFTAIGMNVTDTASAAGSSLLDLQVGGVSQFKVSKAGAATTNTIELGNASDTTISRASAGVVAIEGNSILSAAFKATGTSGNTVPLLDGANTWSAGQTFTGPIQATFSNTTPRNDFYETDGGSNGKLWSWIVDTGVYYLQTRTDADVYGAAPIAITRSGTSVSSIALSATALTFDGGMVVGSATGGSQGAGTINATAVYDDGVLLTCYVLEHWLDGSIDTAAWDARVPNREHPAQTEPRATGEINEDGSSIFETVEIEPARIEVRQHLAARGFAQVADARLDIDRFRQFLSDNRRLPAFPGPDRWADVFNGKMSTGDVLQRLWETVEVLAVHACKARERELALEARIAALENRT